MSWIGAGWFHSSPATPPATPATTPADPADVAGPAVLDLINDQLTQERGAKASLETRAIGVVTTSGTLTTLLFALAALVTKSDAFALPRAARYILLAAVVAFVVAIVEALLVARPASYQEVTIDSLEAITTAENMSAPKSEADPKIAAGLVKIIGDARRGNASKASLLQQAVIWEVAGTVVVAVAVAVVLIGG